jgi:hypothetical protein
MRAPLDPPVVGERPHDQDAASPRVRGRVTRAAHGLVFRPHPFRTRLVEFPGKFRQRVNDSAQLARFTSTTGEPGGSRPPAPSGPVRQRLRHGFGGIGERLVAVGLAFGEDDVAGCIRNDDACILAGTRRNEVPPALAPEVTRI